MGGVWKVKFVVAEKVSSPEKLGVGRGRDGEEYTEAEVYGNLFGLN